MAEYVLFHTHGLGGFDFSTIDSDMLGAIDALAAQRKAIVCPTVYITPQSAQCFRPVLERFAHGRSNGDFSRILGFALEGPVLGPRGGTPTGSVWHPDANQWAEIVSWFSLGLRYIVVSPDAVALDEELDNGLTFAGLVSSIYAAGGRIALGHFATPRSGSDSADKVREILSFVEAGFQSSPYLVLTDHLFNDMPLNFRHAFRSDDEISDRQSALARVLETPWHPSALIDLLGPVPAALLQAAVDRRLTPALNFDGGHVDLEVCRKVVRYLGTSRVIAITDHTETSTLAGERLIPIRTLFYRRDGILAASRVTHEQQRANMAEIGLSDNEIAEVFYTTPLAALQFNPQPLTPVSLKR